MAKVKITSDSTCDLSAELIHRYQIEITPLTVTLGDKCGKDGTEITPGDIYSHVEQTGELPRTSAVNVGEYLNVFSHWRQQGYEVVHFCLSSKMSSSYMNACLAAEEVGGVSVVDSLSISGGQGLLVLHAAELAEKGCSAEEIAAACEALVPKIEASFVINSIDYLRKGGRCSGLAALGANMLNIKPCIEVHDGVMRPGKKYRGRAERIILQYAEDRLLNRTDIGTHCIFITHTECSKELVQSVMERVRTLLPEAEEVIETTASATITSHCGPNTLGILFLRNN